MLNENIKAIRKSKGMSQEDLAVRLNVVRQTVSKWEQGLSVPDSDMLILISGVFDTPVSVLLGENIEEKKADDLSVLAEKLETINLQLASRKTTRQKAVHWFFILLFAFVTVIFAALLVLDSPYMGWDITDPETAVAAAVLHGAEWLFVRAAPFVLTGSAAMIYLTRRKHNIEVKK